MCNNGYMSLPGDPSTLHRSSLLLFYAGAAVFILVFVAWTFSSFRHAEIEELHAENVDVARSHVRELNSKLNKFLLLPLALSDNPDVANALDAKSVEDVATLNEKLAYFKEETSAAYIFVVDAKGRTLASSNYRAEDSFVGRSFQFRPYFQEAMRDQEASFFGKGARTGKVGLFLSRRIDLDGVPMGVVVVKVEFDTIVSNWREANSKTLVADEHGIVLFASERDLVFTSLKRVPQTRLEEIETTRQFWGESLDLIPLVLFDNGLGKDSEGKHILHDEVSVPVVNWRLVRTTNTQSATASADARAMLWSFLLATTIALVGYVFYRRAQHAEQQRKHTELLEDAVQKRTAQLSVANEKLTDEIAQRKTINSRFRAAREELAHANRLGSIGTITASVAHEMNQPIAAVQAFAENGRKFIDRGKYAEAAENYEAIIELSQRMGSITHQLRHYARRGSQGITNVGLDTVLEGVMLLLGDRFFDKGITVEIVGDVDPPPTVRAGFVRLEQVFVNILQNAMEALEDHEAPRIEIAVVEKSNQVCITISDNGPGIPSELLSQIFIPFFTQKKDGLGLGLGITKDILTDMRGALRITASRIGGASFEIELERA